MLDFTLGEEQRLGALSFRRTQAPLSVLLIEPVSLLTRCYSLRTTLALYSHLISVTAIATPGTALAACTAHIQVVVLDLDTDDNDDLATLQSIHAHFPDLAIVALSAEPSSQQLRDVFSYGARAYLARSAPVMELIAAMQLAYRQGYACCAQTAALLLDGLRPSAASHSSGPKFSPREIAIATGVAAGQGNRKIAESLGLSVKTIEYYVTRLLRKTETHSRVQLAIWWRQSNPSQQEHGQTLAANLRCDHERIRPVSARSSDAYEEAV